MKEKNWGWVSIWTGWTLELTFSPAGYFDNRPQILLGLIYVTFLFKLPFATKWVDECDPPRYGIAIHHRMLWIYTGGKGNENGGGTWWTWEFPFISQKFIRHSVLLKDNSWAHDIVGGERHQFYEDEWKEKQAVWNYDYTDKYDGQVIPATIYVEEREWRPKWLTWTSLFAMVRKTIDVKFADEVGVKKGSWKGGAIGCGYDMLPNETPIQCIRRMEIEREFK